MRSLLLAMGFLVSFSVWAGSPHIPVGEDKVFVTSTADNEIKIMSYNVLNLFDAEKDPVGEDWEWLPANYPGKKDECNRMTDKFASDFCHKIDWTQEKVDLKLEQIRKVIAFQGSKPDILAVVEIENENVISMLAKKLGYSHFYVTDSGTRRGVDVALLYNEKAGFKSTGWAPVKTVNDGMHIGRDLLRADFEWNGKEFSVYVNHWVSQGGPAQARIKDAYALRGDIEERIKEKGRGFTAVAVGDFNTTENEIPNAFKDVIHDISWADAYLDLEVLARKTGNESLAFTPPGTYYYGKTDEWNRFDRIAGSKSLNDGAGIEFVKDSLRIPFPEFMSFSQKPRPNVINPLGSGLDSGAGSIVPMDSYDADRVIRSPLRYDFFTENESRRGFSDHLPVIFKLKQ